MSNRTKKKPVFNKWQRWILDHYEGGEMSYCKTRKDLNRCGDGLLKYLVDDIQDSDSSSEVLQRINAAIRGLQELAAAPIEDAD